jgi:hypothetical protein
MTLTERTTELARLVQSLEGYEADGNVVAAIQVRNKIVRVAAIRRGKCVVWGEWIKANTHPWHPEETRS